MAAQLRNFLCSSRPQPVDTVLSNLRVVILPYHVDDASLIGVVVKFRPVNHNIFPDPINVKSFTY